MSTHWQLATRNPFNSPSYQRAGPARRLTCASASTAFTNEQCSCEFGSAKYYALCGFGGILSCGLTHTAVVPLDVVKCRIQVDPRKYRNLFNGLKVTLREDGLRAFGRGWAPTAIGYSAQGLCKFGFYEGFMALYSRIAGEENAYLYRTSLYMAASASAEFIADIALAPMEAVKVRVQTGSGWGDTLRACAPKLWKEEGIAGFYKGLPPLWLRQIPYTMIKFAGFERTLEFLYHHVVPVPRDSLSKPGQLAVTFTAGYIAGILCATVSHPFDSVVSKLNSDAGSSPLQVARELGWTGLWRGLGTRILMFGMVTALQWFIYDTVKVVFHLPRPPPPEMPESLRRKLQLSTASVAGSS